MKRVSLRVPLFVMVMGVAVLLVADIFSGSQLSRGEPLPIRGISFRSVPAPVSLFAAIPERPAFQTLGTNFYALLSPEGIYLTAGQGRIRIRFSGANRESVPQGREPAPAKVHYYVGSKSERWQENVATYQQVIYPDLYPGIHLACKITDSGLKLSWMIHPGASLEDIRVVWDGISRLSSDSAGGLLITTSAGETWRESLPKAYQVIDGREVPVQVDFRLLDDRSYGFVAQGLWDSTEYLFIDPDLSYATFIGGSSVDQGLAIAVDDAGNTFVAGYTLSMNFPATGAPLGDNPQKRNIFVAKIRPEGDLHYALVIGGAFEERANAIGVDASGNTYIAGETFSPDFPVTPDAWQPVFAGYEDAFLLKLDSEGRLVYSTFLGGTGAEEIADIYVDSVGNVYTAGEVYSDDFPLVNPWQSRTYGPEDEDAFISIFNAYGQLVYSTYVGAEERDQIFRIAVGKDGDIYATGMTSSAGFPLVQPLQPYYGGGWDDGFVLKFNPWTNRMIYSTFLGGIRRDEGWGIAVDESGNVYITGRTSSPNFPSVHPWQPFYGDERAENSEEGYDAFIAKMNAQGDALLLSTFVGGPYNDEGWDLASDGSGNIYVVGETGSSYAFPLRNALQPYYGGGESDGFVLVMDSDGNLLYSSFLGGSEADAGRRLVVDNRGIVHVTGYTLSPDFPFQLPVQPYQGNQDAFVARMGLVPPPTPTPTPTPFAARAIGPEGGTLWITYPGHLTLVKVPPGSLSTSTTFTLTGDARPDFQGELQGINHFFRLEAAAPVTPAAPWEVAIGFTETRGVIPDTLHLYRLTDNAWVTSDITLTGRWSDFIEAQIIRLGAYGLLGRTHRLFLPLVMRR